jgi:excisionase family DNA binding protein
MPFRPVFKYFEHVSSTLKQFEGDVMQIVIDLTPIMQRLDEIEAKIDALGNQESAKQVLDAKEAAEFLGIRVSTVYKMTCGHRIPFHKPTGKRLYFKRADLEEYALTGRVCSSDEVEALAQKWLDKNPLDRRTGRSR